MVEVNGAKDYDFVSETKPCRCTIGLRWTLGSFMRFITAGFQPSATRSMEENCQRIITLCRSRLPPDSDPTYLSFRDSRPTKVASLTAQVAPSRPLGFKR